MAYWTIILVACLSSAVFVASDKEGSGGAGCGPLQNIRFQHQWEEAFGWGEDRIEFGLAVFRTMISIEPGLRANLTKFNSADPHSYRFLALTQVALHSISTLIHCLDMPDILAVHLQQVRKVLPFASMTQGTFKTMQLALEQVIPARLDRCFDKEAFNACFGTIVDGLKATTLTTPATPPQNA